MERIYANSEYQYRARVRNKADSPYGTWATLPGVFSTRKEAEKAAQPYAAKGMQISITAGSVNGY